MKITSTLKARLRSHSALCCISAGVIFSLPFMCDRLFPLTYIGLTLFLSVLFEDGEIKKPFGRAFAFFMGALPIVYTWVIELYPFDGFDFTPFQGVVIVILGIFGISAYHSLVISLIFMLTKLLPKGNPEILPPCVGAIFVIYEWFLNIGPLKFSWATIAITQIKFLPLLQTASLFGCYFITFTVVTFCGYAVLYLRERSKSLLCATVSSLLVPILVGSIILMIPTTTEKQISAAVIQGNALSNEKWDEDKLDAIIDTYISLSEEAAQNGAELIVLPESAFPTYFSANGYIYHSLSDIAVKYNSTVISGVLLKDNGKRNAMIAIRPSDGSLTNYYTKNNLVPFGETMPLEKVVSVVMNILGMEFSRTPYVEGTEPDIIELDGVRYGGVICYDSIFPKTVRHSAAAGANIFIIVTNDSWYKDAPAVKQHVYHAVLRAVENGRYIVRAANTGISCFITPKGKIINETQPLVKAISYADVYTVETKTLYTYVGDVPLYLSLAAYCIFALLKIIKGALKHGKHKAL